QDEERGSQQADEQRGAWSGSPFDDAVGERDHEERVRRLGQAHDEQLRGRGRVVDRPGGPRTARSGRSWKARRIAVILPSRGVGPAARAAASQSRARRGDRKSTRLNSSHQITSYAVFCLQNKMK